MYCAKCGSDKIIKFGINKTTRNGAQRYHCNGCNTDDVAVTKTESELMAGLPSQTIDALHERVLAGESKIYAITAAQNATPVWRPFFNSLLSCCEHNDIQLLTIPFRYHNPTSIWSNKAKEDDWWAKDLHPYLFDRRVDIGEHLTILGDVKIRPTAIRPTAGFETVTGNRSAILGHPKIEFLTIPTPDKRLPKIIATTGAITKKNYIPSKAGKRAEHHHAFGAAIIEIGKDGIFFLRQINATHNGSFCDLDIEYRPYKKPRKIRAAGIVLGDLHEEHVDPQAAKAVFGRGGMLEVLRPKEIVWHDILDCYSRTHHHDGQVFINYVKHHNNLNNVQDEMNRAFAFIDKNTPKYAKNIFVYSNHSDMLARWVKRTDPRTDLENCVFWAETFVAMCEGSRLVPGGVETIDPLAHWAKTNLKCFNKSTFLSLKDNHLIKDIEVGYHGHIGLNGARGTAIGFSKIGVKTVTGHIHTPGIIEGAYRVGTMSYLGLDYTAGPSSWLHCHCVIYPNGKRSLLISVGDEWRG